MNRRTFIQKTSMAAGMMAAGPLAFSKRPATTSDYPVMDLHVHLTKEYPIERMVEIAKERNVKFGIVEHPAEWAISDDAALEKYIDNLRNYPVYIGLQPMTSGWTDLFSPGLLDRLDYVLMDPQTIPLGNGEYQRIYELQTYVEDTEVFMNRYMAHSLDILRNEPIDIFGWPLFLPVCIARDYYTLWTEERMQQIIGAARKRNIAIEINDMAHVPHEQFIRMAKDQGLKFTFGSDSRNQNAGRLAYSKTVAQKCGLQAGDFYIPESIN